MTQRKRLTQEWMEAIALSGQSRLDRLLVPALLMAGVLYAGWQVLARDWPEAALFGVGVALLLVLAASRRLQLRVMGRAFNRRHALYIALCGVYAAVWLNCLRLLTAASPTGKDSGIYYALLILVLAFTWMVVRSLLLLTRPFYPIFSTRIPLWEQAFVAANEGIATGILALYGGNAIARMAQPDTFTLRFDAAYTLGIGFLILVYWVGTQAMWVQRFNDWLSGNRVWVRLARLLTPVALVVLILIITRRVVALSDPRTADLLGDGTTNLAILAFAPVLLLVVGVVLFLVYTSNRGLRQRFLPDELLEKLPPPLARFLGTISDMDMLLILGVVSTFIPAYLLTLGDSGGVIGTLREQILQRGSALIETSEQALAFLFTLPFYLLILAILTLYALALGRSTLSAGDRDALIRRLPVGFLITLVITLYLFAVPFTQVLTEGRLPRLPQDFGRILLFDILIPLVLLYAHYFVFIRLPYGRGQSRWRETHGTRLARQLETLEAQISHINGELAALDRDWRDARGYGEDGLERRYETLYRYVQLNSQRDDVNMERLRVLDDRQQMAEVSEAPVSVAVARLPIRIVSIGIPLLLAIQVYQWAVVNNGLREIVNNPNITVFEFFRAILKNFNF